MNKEPLAHIRIYKKDFDVLRRLAVRRSIGRMRIVPVADIVRQLIKEA